MNEAATPPNDPSLVSGRKFMLVGGFVFAAFAGFAVYLAQMRIDTKPSIDLCNRVGVQIERTAGAAIGYCQGIPVPEEVAQTFTPLEETGLRIDGRRGMMTCGSDRVEFFYQFSSSCPDLRREVRVGVSLPPKDLAGVRDDIRPSVVEACRAVLEMNCDCRSEKGLDPGIYASSCKSIAEDRAAGR